MSVEFSPIIAAQGAAMISVEEVNRLVAMTGNYYPMSGDTLTQMFGHWRK